MRSALVALAAVALAVFACSRPKLAPTSAEGIRPTTVIFFIPRMPSSEACEGSCWTRSVAIPRPGAWRCVVGNEIHDPCFAVPSTGAKLVCGSDPALGRDGFPLKLTKPLPPDLTKAPESPPVWIFELEDGSVCEPFTGTMPSVGGQPARWSCFMPSPNLNKFPEQRGLVTRVNRGRIWTADRYAESAVGGPQPGSRRVEAAKVSITRVWQ
jgi:hypothetical protein